MEDIDQLREDCRVNFSTLLGLLITKGLFDMEEWDSAKAQTERIIREED